MANLLDILVKNTGSNTLLEFLDTLPHVYRIREFFMKSVMRQPQILISFIHYDFAPEESKYKIESYPYLFPTEYLILSEGQMEDYLQKHRLFNISLKDYIESI